MKRINLILILIFVINISSFGQICDSCKKDFDKLLTIKNKEKVSQIDLEKSWQISKKLYDLDYHYYFDIDTNNAPYASHSLTKTFSDICLRAGGKSGVDYYFRYLTYTEGSAEEERSVALERLLVKFPEIVLTKIGKNDKFLNDLSLGFLNNRYYGAKNPFENNDFTAITVDENGPKPILNKDNCKAIFFETNPSLKSRYNEYKYQIDYIVNQSIANLKEKKETKIPEGAFPIIIYKEHLYINGIADSIKGNYVFDTGASNLYFDSTYYAENGFAYKDTFTAKIQGAGSTPQTVLVIKDTVKFYFGSNIYKTSIVPVLHLKPILGDIADGILGMEYFYNSVLEINYEKEFMKLYQSIDSVNTTGYSKIGLSKKDNRLYIPLKVNINDTISISGEYGLDFGAGGTVSLTSPVTEKYSLKEKIKTKVAYFTKYGGVGGESSSYNFIANSIGIGDFKFENVVMNFSVDTKGALSTEKHLGLVGNALYERFNMYIDFKNNDLYLKPNEDFSKPFKSSRLGFSYVNRGQTLKSWIVTGLYSSSNAEKGGLKIDDNIKTVNGISVAGISYKLQENYFDEMNEISLGIERKEKNIEINFKLKPILTR